MTGRAAKTRPSTAADARSRLASARQFLDALDALEASGTAISNDVLASNAILAAIAAADAICGARRQLQSASDNHNDAADLLRSIDKRHGDDLAKALAHKNAAAYSTRQTTDAEAKTCRRVAERLFEAAQQAVQGAPNPPHDQKPRRKEAPPPGVT